MEKREKTTAAPMLNSQMLLPLPSPALRGLSLAQRTEALLILARLLLEANGNAEVDDDV